MNSGEWVAYPEPVAARYRSAGLWLGQGLAHIIERGHAVYADRIALIDGEMSWSYTQLRQDVLLRARAMWDLGLRPKQRVLVQFPNCAAGIIAFLAAQYVGLVPVLALPGHRKQELLYFARHASAVAYIGVRQWDGFDYETLLLGLQQELASESLLEQLIWDEPQHTAPGSFGLDCGWPTWASVLPAIESRGAELALLQLSGGSTGTPKLIPRTSDDYLYSIRQSVEVCGWSNNTTLLVVLPWAHNFPMSSPGFLGAWWAGGCVVLSPQPHFEIAWPLLVRHQVSVTSLVPPLAQSWLLAQAGQQHRLAQPTSLSGLERPKLALSTIQVGGAKLSEELARTLAEGFQCRLQQVFGMAEGLVCYTRDGDSDSIVFKTQGRPMSSWDEVRIVDDADLPVPLGATGHLLARGPYTIRGYFRAEEHNACAFTADGFYRTGDLVYSDAEGNLTVVGRAKEQINRGGEKIAPAEIEGYLLRHPKVQAASVVGIVDEHLGERSCAFVVMEPGYQLQRAEMVAFLQELSIAPFKIPDRWQQLETLQTTSAQKVDKKLLRQQAAFDYDALRLFVADLLDVPAAELCEEASLLDQGLDSLRIVALLEKLLEHGGSAGQSLTFFDIAETPSLRHVASLIGLSASAASGT